MSESIICTAEGGITRITLNRPDDGNRVSDPVAVELTELVNAVAKESKVIVLQAAGDDFCLGRAGMGNRPASPPEAYDLRAQNETIFDFYNAFRRAPVPVIGVVQGGAIGFGCAVAGLCDITIAADNARFQLPEMSHNIMPTMAMSALIDRVPRKALVHLVYSTAEIDAQRALTFGLASDVVPLAGLADAADALAQGLASKPLPALTAVKEYARSAMHLDIHAATDLARNLHATINTSSKMQG